MKRPPKRFGMDHGADDTPYAYINARWNQGAAAWDRILVTAPYPQKPVIEVLLALTPTLSSLLPMIGASGIDALIAPFREPPTYWLDRCAGSSNTHAIVHGCRPCGADVLIIDVFGVRASDWSAALDARITPFALRLHAEMSAALAPWRP